MATKKYLSLERLTEYDELIKGVISDGDAATLESANSYADGLAAKKANLSHTHDDRYYTETEIDSKISAVNTSISNITAGTIVVKEAEHATSADSATTAGSATKATQDGNGKVISSTYETKTDAAAKLDEAKAYADSSATTAANKVKNDLLNGAGSAYDTLKELGDLIDTNVDAIEALETVASGKADKSHKHAISDVTDLQDSLDEISEKANESDVFVVNITENGDNYSSDKTYAEIVSAYNDGKHCVARYVEDGYLIECVYNYSSDFEGAVFSNYLVNGISTTEEKFMIFPSGITQRLTGTFTQEKIATKNTNSTLKTTDKTIVGAINELDAKLDSHNHDDVYYTKTEVDTIANGKANTSHTHAISDVTNLQSALDSKADVSHGTHVTFDSTNKPKMNGTSAFGTSTNVARADHVHPTDTSRASKTEFDSHVADTTKHITSTERTNWNAAKTHADSAHAPSNAEKNQNAFSNVKVGTTTVAADTATDTLELVGSNVTITPDATNDKITIAVATGSTSTAGIVKLTNSTSSTSTTTAATPSSVKSAYDLANTAKTNAATAQATADGKADAVHTHKVTDISDLTVSATELNYIDGVTSSVQAQLDSKAASGHGHSDATTSAAGFMTAAMVTKLNGIATGANKTTVDTALSSSSTNPVQNKVVNSAISTLTSSVSANTSSINSHTTSISELQAAVNDIQEITSDDIAALFA